MKFWVDGFPMGQKSESLPLTPPSPQIERLIDYFPHWIYFLPLPLPLYLTLTHRLILLLIYIKKAFKDLNLKYLFDFLPACIACVDRNYCFHIGTLDFD